MDAGLRVFKHSANPKSSCNTCTWGWLRLFALPGSIKEPAGGDGERGLGGGNEEKEEDEEEEE